MTKGEAIRIVEQMASYMSDDNAISPTQYAALRMILREAKRSAVVAWK